MPDPAYDYGINYFRSSHYVWLKENFMKQFILTTLLVFTATLSWASPESLRSVGIEASKDGCYLSDGSKVLGPTVGLLVDAYDHHPKLPNETIIAIIKTAIKAGCNLSEVNDIGLSPLNAAILLNHPQLVRLLLESGADPTTKISSPEESIDSKDSFKLYQFLQARGDYSKIGIILSDYNK